MKNYLKHMFLVIILVTTVIISGCTSTIIIEPTPVNPYPDIPMPYLNALSLTTTEVKKDYFLNEEFNPAGIKGYAIFSNKYQYDVTDKLTIDSSQFDSTKSGTYTIVVKYLSEVSSFKVKVAKLTGLELSISNTKFVYLLHQDFTSQGLIVRALFDHSNHQDISKGFNVDASEFNNKKPGFYTIKVSYGGLTESYVVEVLSPIDIIIDTTNAKINYSLGDNYSITGLKVYAIFKNNQINTITHLAEINFSQFNKDEIGGYEIFVNYHKIYKSYFVTVNEF